MVCFADSAACVQALDSKKKNSCSQPLASQTVSNGVDSAHTIVRQNNIVTRLANRLWVIGGQSVSRDDRTEDSEDTNYRAIEPEIAD